MLETLGLAIMIVIAFFIMFPATWRRRLVGYPVLADVTSSGYVVATYASTGTVSGLSIAVTAAVLISVVIRALRTFEGWEVLTVHGDARLSALTSAALTQSVAWLRTSAIALAKGHAVPAPPGVGWCWVRQTPSHRLLQRIKTVALNQLRDFF